MSDRGVYRKFEIKRTDGSSEPGGKHDGCAYFVLDLEHDRFALPALTAYINACVDTHPALARDLRKILSARPCGCRSVGECPHLLFGPPQTPNEAMNRALAAAGAGESGEES